MTEQPINLQEDARIKLMHSWLVTDLAYKDFELSVASADASFRRYFRITFNNIKTVNGCDVKSLIVMDAPPEQESVAEFSKIAQYWFKNRISVPKIFSENVEQGFLVLEDFGNTTFLQKHASQSSSEKKSAYANALHQLISIQSNLSSFHSNNQLPEYTESLLLKECLLFSTWYLEKHCNYFLNEKERKYLLELYSNLNKLALSQPKVVVHRDFHSRNLMYRESLAYGVIDFQDAVVGPLFYDAASLLKDCYIKISNTLRESLFTEYVDNLIEKGLYQGDYQLARKYFDLMAVQRHLKAIGIFCRLNYRDGKANYLNDIPRTASYIIDLADQYPELNTLIKILQRTLP